MRYSFSFGMLGLLAASTMMSGCIASSQAVSSLRNDIYRLQMKLNEMQRTQADMSAKMDNVNTSMGNLSFELQETQNRMSLLGQKMDDVQSDVSKRMNKISQQVSGTSLAVTPSPSQVYRLAYSDFSRGKYDLAIVGFRSYLSEYPNGELAAQAQYYLGECYYAQEQWAKAVDEFNSVELNYPRSSMIPAARLKGSVCMEMLGDYKESRRILELIVRDYPDSPEAYTAQQKLKTKRADGK